MGDVGGLITSRLTYKLTQAQVDQMFNHSNNKYTTTTVDTL